MDADTQNLLDPTGDCRPVVIIVGNGRWDAYTTSEKVTDREKWLVTLLRQLGGVSADNPDGIYHFNVLPHGRTQHRVSLTIIGN